MVSPFWYPTLILCGLTNVSAQTEPLTIRPSKAAIQPNGNISLKCEPRNPLEQCYFRLHGQFKDLTVEWPSFNSTPETSFSMTQPSVNRTVRKQINVEYTDELPDKCSIQLTQVPEGKYLIGCRALDKNGIWSEKYMALYADNIRDPFQSNNTQANMIIEKELENESGQDNASIELKLEHYNYFRGPCKLDGEENKKWETKKNASLNRLNSICTLPIVWNKTTQGPLWATAPYIKGRISSQWNFMKIIVAKRQANVSLVVNRPAAESAVYNDGDQMNATCSVQGSRHGANISWTYGNKTINTSEWMVVDTKDNTKEWTWPWETKIVEQTISKTLDVSDNGTTLQCTVQNDDNEQLQTETVILVQKEQHTTNPTTLLTRTQQHTEVNTIPFTTVANVISEIEFQSFTTLLLSLCLILALAVVAAAIYARWTRKCYFKPRVNNIEEMEMVERPQKESSNSEAQEHRRKPRAKTPEQPMPNAAAKTEVLSNYDAEEAVVYAVIEGPQAATGHRTKITMTEETQYAELSFE